MTIEVEVSHKLPSVTLDARFQAGGGLVALFGPSGSGKTTLINIIAGLIEPDFGRISVNGALLLDTGKGFSLPTHRRRLGYVFQESRLFPHLSVRQNLLYGRWFALGRQEKGELARIVDLLGIGHLLDRSPGKLSGGEKQRVAIGRALLSSPRLLLMDEPLASLDEARKQEILPYIERLRDEARVPIVYVSHELGEISRLASTLVLLREGKVLASGPTVEITQRLDLTAAVGGEAAGAMIEGVVEAHDETYGFSIVASRAGKWRVSGLTSQAGSRIRLRIQARDVVIALEKPEAISALNVMPATIVEIAPLPGANVEVKLDCNGEALLARLTRFSVERLSLQVGAPVYAIVKAAALSEDGRAIERGI